MKRLTTDHPDSNFETVLNYVYGKDGAAYLRSDGARNDVPVHEWAKEQCKARGCDEFPGTTLEEIDEAICGCAFDFPDCPVFLAYTFACQAVHLRDRLKMYEDVLFAKDGSERISLDRLCTLASPPPNDPLTLEELRKMDGEPVWSSYYQCWGLVSVDIGGRWAGVPFFLFTGDGCKHVRNIEQRRLKLYRRKLEVGTP